MKVNNYRKITFAIGAIFILLGIVTTFIAPGFNWAIEFTGGYETQISIGKAFEVKDVEETFVNTLNFKPDSVQKTSDTDHEHMVTIKCKELSSEQRVNLFNAIVERFEIPYDAASDEAAVVEETTTEETAAEEVATEEVTEEAIVEDSATEATAENNGLLKKTEIQIVDENVDPTIGSEMRKSAIIAALIALLLMLLYITFRFELLSGLVAIIMLFHDVMVVLAAYALLQIPVGSTFIAVVLTIVGYSINATIIVFDRIRENVKANPKALFADNVDKSVAQTFTRSIYTTFTTLITILVLYIFAFNNSLSSIVEFALPIIIGLIGGTFSSVFLAGPLWTVLRKGKKQVK